MSNWSNDIDGLQGRLGELIDRTELGDDARELSSEALEELGVIIEEMQAQNAELIASRGELDEERHRYRALFETVPDGYLITNPDGMILEANATACTMFGRPRNKVIGKPLALFIEPSDQRAFYAHLNRVRHTASGGQLMIDLAVHDHGTVPANLRATVGEAIHGHGRDIRWLIHDRSTEVGTKELRASEERLRALFDAADVGIVLCDISGRVIFINQYASSVLQYRPRPTAVSSWLGATHPDDLGEIERLIQAALAAGEAGSLRHRLVHDDGVTRWVDHDIVPFRNDDGSVTGFVSTLADVTVEHDAMVDLQASRDFTAALLDTVGALVVVLDTDGRILRFNRTCEDLTGRRADDVIGRSLVEVLVPEDQRNDVHAVLSVLSTPGTNTFENDWQTADGERRRISWTNTNLAGPDGRVTAVIGTGIDVTDQRLLESRVAQADRLESVGRLTAGIAHDFNNTLATLRLRIDRLSGRLLEPASQADLAAATQTIDRTQNLIADLLSFSRTQDLQPVPTDINAETNRISDMLSNLLGPNTVIELDLTDDDSTAFIDPGRFDQILTNLALNADDAMPDGGTLTIATTLVDIARTPNTRTPSAPQLPPGTYVRLTATDTGSGIAPRDIARIFDPYFTTKPPGRGTGLGLATTYGTIHQSGGAIVVDSEPGTGTTFTIWFPHHPCNANSAARTTAGLVLIVEDDADVRDVLVTELEQRGYTTHVAGDGAQAMDHIDAPIDVLLCDVHLPDTTGPAIANRFRTRHPGLAIVYMSGETQRQLREALPAEATFLQKPFTADELDTTIGRARRST